eukprot:3935167-Rhodomonas_salina.6
MLSCYQVWECGDEECSTKMQVKSAIGLCDGRYWHSCPVLTWRMWLLPAWKILRRFRVHSAIYLCEYIDMVYAMRSTKLSYDATRPFSVGATSGMLRFEFVSDKNFVDAGTDSATSLRACYAMPGSDMVSRSGAIRLHACYAMSGTHFAPSQRGPMLLWHIWY